LFIFRGVLLDIKIYSSINAPIIFLLRNASILETATIVIVTFSNSPKNNDLIVKTAIPDIKMKRKLLIVKRSFNLDKNPLCNGKLVNA